MLWGQKLFPQKVRKTTVFVVKTVVFMVAEAGLEPTSCCGARQSLPPAAVGSLPSGL